MVKLAIQKELLQNRLREQHGKSVTSLHEDNLDKVKVFHELGYGRIIWPYSTKSRRKSSDSFPHRLFNEY